MNKAVISWDGVGANVLMLIGFSILMTPKDGEIYSNLMIPDRVPLSPRSPDREVIAVAITAIVLNRSGSIKHDRQHRLKSIYPNVGVYSVLHDKMKQVRLLIASNAGGSGKTTTALHIAYELTRAGKKVAIVELDHNGSISAFTGLTDEPTPDRTLLKLWHDFDGNYPLESLWSEYTDNLSVIRGGQSIEQISREIATKGRGFYFLADILEDHPLDLDVIIFDTPATLEPMGIPGYLAATHLICPIKPEIKDAEMVAQLITWTTQKNKEFRLKQPPQILGFVPTRADYSQAVHRNILGVDEKGQPLKDRPEDSLPAIFAAIGMTLFPPIKQSAYYLTACQEKRPLPTLNARTAKNRDYQPIANSILSILKSSKS